MLNLEYQTLSYGDVICLDSDKYRNVNGENNEEVVVDEVHVTNYIQALKNKLVNRVANSEEEAYQMYCEYAFAFGI